MLFLSDPEAIHHLAMDTLAVTRRDARSLPPRPIRGSSGPSSACDSRTRSASRRDFDKNGVALPAWEALGFGFAEIGTITARAQPGNPKPRIFRVPEAQALINRLGFNNDGCDVVAARLHRLRHSGRWPGIPVGINIGKSKVTPLHEATADYLLSFERLQHFGDYFVLNVSSPNTPGLRSLQDRPALDELLGHIQRRNTASKPVLVKIAPDLEWAAIEEIIALVNEHRLAGLIATNTTIDHSAFRTRAGSRAASAARLCASVRRRWCASSRSAAPRP